MSSSSFKAFHWDDIIVPLTIPASMIIFGKLNLVNALIMWNIILCIATFLWSLIAVNAGHHGTNIVHEGDEFESLDFGIYQIVTTIDRNEANSCLFMMLTHFGKHLLHHMFPALDHAVLPQLEDEFLHTCHEFNQQIKQTTLMAAAKEQFKQLSRTKFIEISSKISIN